MQKLCRTCICVVCLVFNLAVNDLTPGLAYASSLEPVELHLKAGSFDPAVAHLAPSSNTFLGLPAETTEYYIIQFAGPTLPSWRQLLVDEGCEILDYIPDFSYLVRASPQTIASLKANRIIRWIESFKPGYKVDPDVYKAPQPITVSVKFHKDAFPPENSLTSELVAKAQFSSENMVRLDVTLADIVLLARDESVEWIEQYFEPQLQNSVGREIMTVPQYWQKTGLYGAGQIVAVCDTGLDTGDWSTLHLDVRGRVIKAYAYGRPATLDWSDPNGHGTHVAGSVLGSGTASSSNPSSHTFSDSFAGSAPEASLVFQSVGSDSAGSLSGLSVGLTTILNDAYESGARIHTNSWGDISDFGKYKFVRARSISFAGTTKTWLCFLRR
ncbi:MAG: S8 family serine peptidase, partial [Armatimonadota bacterium]